jgi:hypothetical protein
MKRWGGKPEMSELSNLIAGIGVPSTADEDNRILGDISLPTHRMSTAELRVRPPSNSEPVCLLGLFKGCRYVFGSQQTTKSAHRPKRHR